MYGMMMTETERSEVQFLLKCEIEVMDEEINEMTNMQQINIQTLTDRRNLLYGLLQRTGADHETLVKFAR